MQQLEEVQDELLLVCCSVRGFDESRADFLVFFRPSFPDLLGALRVHARPLCLHHLDCYAVPGSRFDRLGQVSSVSAKVYGVRS